MRRPLALLTLVLSPIFLQAGETSPKVVFEAWDVVYLQGARAGYSHLVTHEIDGQGGKVYRSTLELRLTVKRFNDTIQLGMDTGTRETADGKVIGVSMKQMLGKGQTLEIAGTVNGPQLELILNGKQPLKPAPWDENVVGLFRQQSLFQKPGLKPGDEFAYRSFEPTINLVITNRVKIHDYEEVELAPGSGKKKLLRVEIRPDKVQSVQLPTMHLWLNDQFQQVRSEAEMPPLGKLVSYRTQRETALAQAAPPRIDLGETQLVRLKQRILRPLDVGSAVYRIQVVGEENPGSAFAQDVRQEVKNVQGDTLELHIDARGFGGNLPEEKAGPEFLESSYFINSADLKVKEFARKAVGLERDPWRKALLIERWVHGNMRVRTHEQMATADHVAQTLEGDCTEYAMLMAAMCRAEGVPSRTAIGLIYAENSTGPFFAFHMWTEVWIGGRWVPLDATLGRGYVGATHLKICAHSWHEERSLQPILPVTRVLGKLRVEVLRAELRP